MKSLLQVLMFGIVMVDMYNCAVCPQQLDLVFLVDSSGSIKQHNWDILKEFLVKVVDRFEIGPDAVRVAVVQFATSVYIAWNLNGWQTQYKTRLQAQLRGLYYPEGYTNTGGGLLTVASEILQPSAGDRNDVPNLVIVITDGKSNQNTAPFEYNAEQLKTMTRVISIGVTDKIMFDELETMATSTCDIHTVDTFNEMDDDMDSTMDLICGCMPGQKVTSSCKCEKCPVNTYQAGWSMFDCETCPAGTRTLDTGAASCLDDCGAGYRLNTELETCEPCPLNTYQPESFSTDCIPCPDGTITLYSGSVTDYQCIDKCNAGEKFNITTKECEKCPTGYYQPFEGQTTCIKCNTGYTTPADGAVNATQCFMACGPGTELYPDIQLCMSCQFGFYQPEPEALVCRRCPDGTTTQIRGATNETQCTAIVGSADPQTSNAEGNNNSGLIAGIVVVVLVLLIVGILLLVFFVIRRRRKDAGVPGFFVAPPPDKSHVYDTEKDKASEAANNYVYDNPDPRYDNPTKAVNPRDNTEVEYSNVGAARQIVEESDYECCENVKKGLDNPVYENHQSLNIIR